MISRFANAETSPTLTAEAPARRATAPNRTGMPSVATKSASPSQSPGAIIAM